MGLLASDGKAPAPKGPSVPQVFGGHLGVPPKASAPAEASPPASPEAAPPAPAEPVNRWKRHQTSTSTAATTPAAGAGAAEGAATGEKRSLENSVAALKE